MRCFTYPYDSKFLKRKKAWIKETLLAETTHWIDCKIAVLGGSTTNEITDQLELFLLNDGIRAVFYQSEYGKYYEDAVFGNDVLNAFSPDLVFLHTNWRNIGVFPSVHDSDDAVSQLLEKEYKKFESVRKAIEDKFGCPVIQNNFDRPDYRLMGNRDIWDIRGRSHFIFAMNQLLYQYAGKHPDFYINDIDYIASCVGMDKWNSPIYWHMYKYICDYDAIPYLAASAAHIIKSLYGKNKKLLAVDLDHTIWGGVVGEDGVDGLLLGNETPKGEVYADIQSYLKKLREIGVVLAIASKNDYQNAIDGLRHPDSVLCEDDFVAIEANWEPKDQNIKKIADAISLGTDSFVFMDDNPAERGIVSNHVPGVSVPELVNPEDFIRLVDRGGYFETTILSEEDQKKTEQYKARSFARQAESAYSDYGEYLEGLDMKAEIRGFQEVYIQRIAQLVNKSNQFNLTALRCTENDIRAMNESGRYLCLYGKLFDKFCDHGVVAVSIGELVDDTLHIRLWLMSCRVLKRGLEDAMMNVFIEKAKAHGCKSLAGYYYPTPKNSMVKDFYSGYGFSLSGSEENGSTRWEIRIDEYIPKGTHILMK